MLRRSTTSRFAFISGTGSQPINCPTHQSAGARAKASRKFSVPSEISIATWMTRMRSRGAGSAMQIRLPSSVATPAHALTAPKAALPPPGRESTIAGSAASKAEATKFTQAKNNISASIMRFARR